MCEGVTAKLIVAIEESFKNLSELQTVKRRSRKQTISREPLGLQKSVLPFWKWEKKPVP